MNATPANSRFRVVCLRKSDGTRAVIATNIARKEAESLARLVTVHRKDDWTPVIEEVEAWRVIPR
ncbi:MAG: hypothetical protein ACT4QC_11425 [Planctomycetaceae bacterium]